MNRFIALALMLVSGCVAFAATPGSPSFNSFNTDQFSTTGSRVALKDGVLVTNLINHGEMTSDSTATGSEFFGDGGSFGYRITPPTMSGFINFIPDTSAQTGVPYHTAIGTNVYETHLPLIWTNSAGIATLHYPGIVEQTTADVSSLSFKFQLDDLINFGDAYANLQMSDANGSNPNAQLSITVDSTNTVSGAIWGFRSAVNDGDSFINFYDYDFGDSLVYLRPTAASGTDAFIFGTKNTYSIGNLLTIKNSTNTQFTVNALGGLTTGLPTGATNAQPFKIGSEANAIGLVLVATNYIQIELNGVAYKLGLVK